MSRLTICGACRYWKPGPTIGLVGECRRRPPVLLMFSDRPETHFPEANREDWCGEWVSFPTCSGSFTQDQAMVPCQRRVGHTGACGQFDAISGGAET